MKIIEFTTFYYGRKRTINLSKKLKESEKLKAKINELEIKNIVKNINSRGAPGWLTR